MDRECGMAGRAPALGRVPLEARHEAHHDIVTNVFDGRDICGPWPTHRGRQLVVLPRDELLAGVDQLLALLHSTRLQRRVRVRTRRTPALARGH